MRRLLLVAALIALMSLQVAAQTPKSYFCEIRQFRKTVLGSARYFDIGVTRPNTTKNEFYGSARSCFLERSSQDLSYRKV